VRQPFEQGDIGLDANIHSVTVELAYHFTEVNPLNTVLREEVTLKSEGYSYPIPGSTNWDRPWEIVKETYPKYCFKKYWGNVNWTTAQLAAVLIVCL
jgi:hypothetical protein